MMGDLWQIIKAWAWLHLRSDRSRFDYITRVSARRPDLCWCSLVDAWWRATPSWRSDYRKPHGTLLDFPLPRNCYTPRPTKEGICYCPITVEERALEAEMRAIREEQ